MFLAMGPARLQFHAQGKPLLAFEEKFFNFETVTEGTVVSHEFKFTNKGEGDLVIAGVTADCGCVTISYTPNTSLPPGGVGSVTARVNTAGKEGVQEYNVIIDSNSEGGTVKLFIRGIVSKATEKQKTDSVSP